LLSVTKGVSRKKNRGGEKARLDASDDRVVIVVERDISSSSFSVCVRLCLKEEKK
jgi:hypothetical protein